MKNIILYFIFVVISTKMIAQDSMLDIVAKQTCEYLESEEMKSISNANKQEKLGLFIINKYNENVDKFKEEGLEIDFTDGSNSGRQFGEKVGMNMAKFCPETLIALAGDIKKDPEETIDNFVIEGNITKIIGDDFSTVVLKDTQGKTQKFIWLQNFSGSDKLMDFKEVSKKTPKVELFYRNIECFSPKLKDYIIRKEIIEIKFL